MGLSRTQLMFVALHRAVYRATGGRLLGRFGRIEQVLLTTTGRSTGKARTTPLAGTPDGERLVLVASNNGGDAHPSWYLNLVANPQVSVQRGATVTPMTARTAEGAERERLWDLVVRNNPGYARYAQRTTRHIPVVVCEPLDR
ncbi:nitroreductase family deazaflavin-dependent oxidoreductase [Cellulomonas sp. NTE-D12]|uniref:nitroreductase family deazaflavin-dependent oxidoreductase n=1 Tax=Cellulomonas sp. NTE-D12 TaxID=2962632 RepID=UPI00308129A4|nr:hypothetical protein CELD12_32480 [Cellulomonas sp. NTE-D12]